MFDLIESVVFAVVVAGVSVWALVEAVTFGRRRYRYRSLNDDATITQAAASVVEARTRLAAVIDAEQRTASVGSGGNGLLSSEAFDDERVVAREALLDTQRLWEAVRPRRDTAARAGLWSGRGSIRSWHLGLIGFERVIIRCDHIVDPSCWVLREYHRVRIGFGVGVESRSLALFAAGLPSRRIDELMRHMISGPECALRPGRSPVAIWRLSRRDRIAQNAARAVLVDRDLTRAPSPATIEAVRTAIHADFGDVVGSRPLSGLEAPIGVVHTSGPSLLVGAWFGTRPRSHLLASSQHTVWRESP